jgi:hypothetical protein
MPLTAGTFRVSNAPGPLLTKLVSTCGRARYCIVTPHNNGNNGFPNTSVTGWPLQKEEKWSPPLCQSVILIRSNGRGLTTWRCMEFA